MFYLIKLMMKRRAWFIFALLVMIGSAALTVIQANAIARVFSMTVDIKNAVPSAPLTGEEASLFGKIHFFFQTYFQKGNREAVGFLMSQHSFLLLILVMFSFLSVVFLLQIVSYFKDVLNEYLAVVATTALRSEVYTKLIHLSPLYYKKKDTSLVLTRLVDDLTNSRNLMVKILEAGMYGPIIGVMGIAALLFINYKFIFAGALAVIVLTFVINFVSSLLKRFVHRVQKSMENILSNIQRIIYGMDVIKVFNRSEDEKNNFLKESVDYERLSLKQILVASLNRPMTEFFTFLGIIFLLVYVITLIWDQAMSIDDLFNIFTIGLFVAPYIQRFGTVFFMKQQVDVYINRVRQILEEPEEERPAPTGLLNGYRGNVRYEGVSFRYEQEDVLDDVSLDIKSGQITAIVGLSGSGKSTLVSLLCGFMRPSKGKIFFDEVDTQNVSLEEIRRQVSLVTQDNVLFPMTIAENIGYAKPGCSREEIVKVAQEANIHDHIVTLEKGYDTELSDMGKILSGGQRQRICLARALLKESPLLVLDEATSALDSASEKAIQESIDKLRGKKTIVIIAHRMSTIRSADTIVVLEKGKILQKGSHDDLVKEPGRYSDFIRIQT